MKYSDKNFRGTWLCGIVAASVLLVSAATNFSVGQDTSSGGAIPPAATTTSTPQTTPGAATVDNPLNPTADAKAEDKAAAAQKSDGDKANDKAANSTVIGAPGDSAVDQTS